MKKVFIMTLVKLRWWYFHIHPNYIKFCVEETGKDTEWYFQNHQTGEIVCNLKWVDNIEVNNEVNNS